MDDGITLKECLAEFAGTMILILFGCGVVAQVVAGGKGEFDSIAWAWGIGGGCPGSRGT